MPEVQYTKAQFVDALAGIWPDAHEMLQHMSLPSLCYRKAAEAFIEKMPGSDTLEMLREQLKSLDERGQFTFAECEHEWVDARNKYVESGEICRKCRAIRALTEG